MITQKIEIVDHHANDGLLEATLRVDLLPSELADVEADWGPLRRDAVRKLLAEGYPPEKIPQHYHWDWGKKRGNLALLSCQCYGIECEGQCQGLVMMSTIPKRARLDPDKGKPLVYVDYLETAPWNFRLFCDRPRFGAVGTRLYESAVELSKEEGFRGRVGLHSLPQAEVFYSKTCGMTALEHDPAVQGLRYFEATPDQADAFLRGV